MPEFTRHTLYYIIPDYLLLELKPKIKKSLLLLEDEPKLEMTIDSISHVNSNFAFSQIHEVWVNYAPPRDMLESYPQYLWMWLYLETGSL